jgi:hypothetical protein
MQPLRVVERVHARSRFWEVGDDLGEDSLEFSFEECKEASKSRMLQKSERASFAARARERGLRLRLDEQDWPLAPRYK